MYLLHLISENKDIFKIKPISRPGPSGFLKKSPPLQTSGSIFLKSLAPGFTFNIRDVYKIKQKNINWLSVLCRYVCAF